VIRNVQFFNRPPRGCELGCDPLPASVWLALFFVVSLLGINLQLHKLAPKGLSSPLLLGCDTAIIVIEKHRN
jgi:hypothetical protein